MCGYVKRRPYGWDTWEIKQQHGWEVELLCPHCGHMGLPKFDEWTPHGSIDVGHQRTIPPEVRCSACRQSLKLEAANKLVELFANATSSTGILMFLTIVFAWLVVVVIAGVCLEKWGNGWLISSSSAIVCFLLTAWIIRRFEAGRFACKCGEPTFVFMGWLGHSYCYRCSSCGRLIRVRAHID